MSRYRFWYGDLVKDYTIKNEIGIVVEVYLNFDKRPKRKIVFVRIMFPRSGLIEYIHEDIDDLYPLRE